ncbi:putative FAD-dependent oxidoreductase [Paratrimastix pyriformis]|uniref:FAD-dependent oxidoreductase n=1 Tax=Paratrimastix pyriformis TaxID=342808 RepID=A0ABQ8UCC9_9EUKA|nr:putative FAD-dependent oxidoreductase [Paratrimastix pyriformis]
MTEVQSWHLAFQPFELSTRLSLRNRIVCPPMVTQMNVNSEKALTHYRAIANGGAGLVILECVSLPRFLEGGDLHDGVVLRRLSDAVHSAGAKVGAQIFAGFSRFDPPGSYTGTQFSHVNSPSEFTRDGIQAVISGFREALRVLSQAGFDVIEPHGAHGFLLNQFFSPVDNTRVDEYGPQSTENRMRFGREIVAALAEENAKVGRPLTLFYRHSPEGHGYSPADSVQFAQCLYAAGLDCIDLSPDSAPVGRLFREGVPALPGRTPLRVMVVGALERDRAGEEALAQGAADGLLKETRFGWAANGLLHCKGCDGVRGEEAQGAADVIALGRQLLCDPSWPTKMAAGRQDEIEQCAKCGACLQLIFKGREVMCPKAAAAARRQAGAGQL